MNATREIQVPLDPTLFQRGESIWLRIQMEEPQPPPTLKPTSLGNEVVTRYRLWREGCEWGPYSLKDLRRFWSMGTLEDLDYVREESEVEWHQLSELVASVPNHIACSAERPVRLDIRTADLDDEEADYFYPPFSGISWYAASAAACSLGAVILSLSPISQFTLAVSALVLGFLLAAKGCLTNQNWLGMAVPVLAVWLVTMVQLDHNHWTPFAAKTPVAAPSPTPAPDSTLSLIMFPPPEKPMTQVPPLFVETPPVSDAPVVWVEYSENP